MFRKTWKTIRFFLILAVIIICIPHSLLPGSGEKTAAGSKDEKAEMKDSLKRDFHPADSLDKKKVPSIF